MEIGDTVDALAEADIEDKGVGTAVALQIVAADSSIMLLLAEPAMGATASAPKAETTSPVDHDLKARSDRSIAEGPLLELTKRTARVLAWLSPWTVEMPYSPMKYWLEVAVAVPPKASCSTP